MPGISIFSRYAFRQTAGALLLILLSLSGIVWIALALRELNVVTSQGQSAATLLLMTTLALPNLMAIIAPVALLIAAVHTLNRLNGDSELIVLTASGAGMWTVIKPFLVLAAIVAIAISLVNHFVLPWSLKQLRATIVEVRTDLLTQVIQPGRFSSPEQGLTFHIRERAPNGDLLGLIMDDTRNPKEAQSYLAEKGVILEQDGASYLLMTEGHILRRADAEEPAQILAFDKYAVDLDRFEPKTKEARDLRPRESYYRELVAPNPKNPSFKQAPGQFAAELHERFSNPFYPLAFVMIALAFVGQAQSTRQNRAERIGGAFLAALVSRLSGLATNNLAVLHPAALVFLYAIPIGAALAAGYWIWLARTPKDRIGIGDRLAGAAGALRRLRPGRRSELPGVRS